MSGENTSGADSPNAIFQAFERDKAEAAKWARVYVGDPQTLLLDLDGPAAMAQYIRVLPVVSKTFGVSEQQRWESKNGNTHILLHAAYPMTVMERLILQASLGSDGVREALGLWRFENGVAEPSMLFKPRKKAEAGVLYPPVNA